MSDSNEWYLNDRVKMETIGPFPTSEMIRKIVTGEIRVDDFVWGQHLDEARWRRIYELEDFRLSLVSPPKHPVPKRSRGHAAKKLIAQIKFENQGDYAQNIYRRFPRVPIVGDAIIHNGKFYRKGACVDVSETGLFVKMDDLQAFQKGEEVTIVVKTPDIGMFTTAAVVTRVLVEGEFLAFCGLYFLRLSPMIRRKIARYIISQLQTVEDSPVAS